MKKFLSWIVLLCLLLPGNGLAAMTGNPSMDRIEPRNTSLYAVYDGDTGCMYFWIPGKYGFCHIYQYHPDIGWKLLLNLWGSRIKNMIVSDGVLYYTLYGELDATGEVCSLYALNLKTRRTSRLLRDQTVIYLEAAGDGKLLVMLRTFTDERLPSGYHYDDALYFYDLHEKRITAFDISEYVRCSFMEKGMALGKPDGAWGFYDYAVEDTTFEISFRTDNFVHLYSPRYWTEQLMGTYDTSIFLDGEMIYGIEGYEGITENAQYVIWYHAPKGRQMVHVLDVYASEKAPQIAEYELNVTSNIYLLDHWAVMRDDEDTGTLTMIDLSTGAITQISPDPYWQSVRTGSLLFFAFCVILYLFLRFRVRKPKSSSSIA